MAKGKTLVLNIPTAVKGEELEVSGLGLFQNGKTHELTKEQVENWEVQNNRKFPGSEMVIGVRPEDRRASMHTGPTTHPARFQPLASERAEAAENPTPEPIPDETPPGAIETPDVPTEESPTGGVE